MTIMRIVTHIISLNMQFMQVNELLHVFCVSASLSGNGRNPCSQVLVRKVFDQEDITGRKSA